MKRSFRGGSEASEPGMTIVQLARWDDPIDYFQSMILLASPSNSMLQNAPP
jgi:hypothetical protein